MAAMAGALTYATTALSAAQAVHQHQIGKVNVRAEKKMGELRADKRRADLKRTLAAQRVVLTQQGRDPDFGSVLVLYDEAREAAKRESAIDKFQTKTSVQNIKSGAKSSIFRTVGGTGKSLLSARTAKEQQKVA